MSLCSGMATRSERVDELDSSYKQLQWLKLKSLAATMFEIIAVTAVKTFYD